MSARVLMVLLGLICASCQRPAYLLVAVEAIPPSARSLVVLATHQGTANTSGLQPFELPEPARESGTLLLTLPEGFSGDVRVDVAAMDQPGGQGCLLAQGGDAAPEFMGPGQSLRASLSLLDTPYCASKQPALFSATPSQGSIEGGERLTVRGWGFRPGATVTLGGQAVTASILSAAEIQLTTPAFAGFGPVPIQVTNPDGNTNSRSDIFRFYSPANYLNFNGSTFDSGDTCYISQGWRANPSFAVGKFSKSGDTQLVIALPTLQKLRVFTLNHGLLQPEQWRDYELGYVPGAIVMDDFNSDGTQDLIVINDSAHTFQIFWNDGNGNFTPIAAAETGTTGIGAHALASGDLNNDGRPDLVITDELQRTVRVLFNIGLGQFALQPDELSGPVTIPQSAKIVDITGDAQPEIIAGDGSQRFSVSNESAGRLFVFQTSPQGVPDRKLRAEVPIGLNVKSMAVGDINGDAINDLIAATVDSGSVHVFSSPLVWPIFSGFSIPVGASPGAIALGDVNGDGYKDLVLPIPSTQRLLIFINNQGRGFEGVSPIAQSAGCASPQAVVFYEDRKSGVQDLLVVGDGCVATLLNCPPGSGCSPVTGTGGSSAADSTCKPAVGFGPAIEVPGPVAQVISADFNSDGRLDIAAVDNANTVSLRLGDGTGQFAAPRTFAVGAGPTAAVVGDFNRDLKPDLAVTNGTGNSVSVLLGDGLGGLGPATTLAVGVFPRAVAVGDFNRDMKPDLVVSNSQDGTLSVLLGDGTGGFSVASPVTVGSVPRGMAVADLNGDLKPDLAVATAGDNSLRVLLGDGAGGFLLSSTVAVGVGPNAVIAGLLNEDAFLDLAVSNNSNASVSVLLGDGTGTFRLNRHFPVGPFPGNLAMADFNGDLKPDLVTPQSGGFMVARSYKVTVLLGDGRGGFGQAFHPRAGLGTVSVATGDFNGDLRPDLIIANDKIDSISLILNQTL